MNNTVMNKSSNVEDTDNKEIEVIRDSLKKRPDGSPRQTIENVIEVLNKDPMLKDAIRRNELSCKTDIVKKMDWRRRSKTFTDTDFNNIMLRMEKFYGITRDKNIKRAIDIVGNNNHYRIINTEYIKKALNKGYLVSFLFVCVPKTYQFYCSFSNFSTTSACLLGYK